MARKQTRKMAKRGGRTGSGELNGGRQVTALRKDILDELFCRRAKFPEVATPTDRYLALAYAVRDRMLHRWVHTAKTYFEQSSRTVAYLSAEYLLGPQLAHNLLVLGIQDPVRKAVESLGWSMEDILETEEEPGLGSGGMGRLAACFMDSLATLEIPTIGYGIRYEFGIFDQEIRGGWQVEVADRWLRMGNPWEIPHPEIRFPVGFGGRTEWYTDAEGRRRIRWIPERVVSGIAYDTAALGYGVETANMLRLWKAEGQETFDFQAFNHGDYYRAVQEAMESENITKVLYPNDEPTAGKELRLEQQYFFVSCSLQDMLRIHRQKQAKVDGFHRKYSIQLNDTHPAIAVAELMRLLVDEHALDWERAWSITTSTFGYTNHTLMSEALERWPVSLFGRVLPRHMEIVREINRRFLSRLRLRYPVRDPRMARLSIIEEGAEPQIRMAHLACVGSRAINGVAALHTALLKKTILKDFHDLWPEKFSNKTNGVTPRRFLLLANPSLSALITEAIGDGWIRDLNELRGLERFADDAEFRRRWAESKKVRKQALAALLFRRTGVAVDAESLFDVQVKRIHEYKRQHLNVLNIVGMYLRLKTGQAIEGPPRTFIFGGKAAPGYAMAKLIIKLIHSVAEVVNGDTATRPWLRVVFLPDFNVKNGQQVYPAAELSEQISLAGKEASGTGNMKFAMNGALTIGTLDGANIEIREQIGEENFFQCGLTAADVARRKAEGYVPRILYEGQEDLRAIIDFIGSGGLPRGEGRLFEPLVRSLLEQDEYMVLADYASYANCQRTVGRTYLDADAWWRRSILTVARMGYFSSDRAVREYCRDIWKVEAVPVRSS